MKLISSWLLAAAAATAGTAAATELLLPLYQYPSNLGEAWNPVKQAIAENANLTFKVVLSPAEGPGGVGQGLDNRDYVAGAQNLSSFDNVQILGYVHTIPYEGAPRCTMPWEQITADIRTWSTWATKNITIHGIFIDESLQNSDENCLTYMRNLTDFIRHDPDLNFPSRFVVFNAGGVGNLQPFYDLDPTLIVALETCFREPHLAEESYDGCPNDPAYPYERYDHNGFGSTVNTIVLPSIGADNANRTGIVVHGFHKSNGPSFNYTASEVVLRNMIRALVQRDFGAAFFTTGGYHHFEDGPADIVTMARLLNEANANF